VLCPAELLAHMQFLFVSVTPAVENPPNVRRKKACPKDKDFISHCRAEKRSGLLATPSAKPLQMD